MKIQKIMQITMRNGIHHHIGMENGKEEFPQKRKLIKDSKDDLVDVVDTCTIRKSEIQSIEYYEQGVDENAESNPDPTK